MIGSVIQQWLLDAQRQIAELEAAVRAKDAVIGEQAAQLREQAAQIAKLTEQVAQLTERLSRNSRNSNQPPSRDPPGRRGKPGKNKKSKRKRGGQPGHKGSRRELVPAEKVDEVVNLFPERCHNCWAQLPETPDPRAKRYQVTEVPPVVPHTTEFRRHAVRCACGHTSKRPYDECPIPASRFGPRLQSLVALLTGVYHVSRRKSAQLLWDIVGVRLSVGALSAIEERVSKAVEPAVNQAWSVVENAAVRHADGTSWLQAGRLLSLWTIATRAATVYKIVPRATRATLQTLFRSLRGILVSDRAKALNFWAMERRQICWSHLLRRFILFSEREGPTGTVGRELLEYTALLFEYWHDYQAGRVDRRTFQAWMRPVRIQLEALLGRAVAADIRGLSGSCADIVAHKDALWTFVDCDGVEPTNNHAERELRGFVLWRKRSFGTQSERGNRFAERIMTVAHTARKQRVDVLTFLTACCQARQAGTAGPSLFDADAAALV